MAAARRTPTIAADRTGRLILLSNRLNLTYWLIRAGSRLAALVPLRVGYAIAAAIADLVFGVWGGIRGRTTENMRWVVGPDGDAERPRQLARAAFRNYLRYLVEFLRIPHMSPGDVARSVDVQGVENLHAAMRLGKGVIAVGFHFGNIDLGAAVLAQVGYPVNVVVDTFEPPRLDALIQRYREEKGLKLIPLEVAPRQALRALRKNEVLALLIDKPTPEDGVVVRLFGGEVAIPSGAALLALRTGAPLVACCVFRRGAGRFLAEVAPMVDPATLATGDARADVRVISQRLVDALESWIRREPAQWYPFRRMWLGRLAPS